MLDLDPTIRPSVEQCLAHRWFKEDKELVSEMIFLNKRSVSPYPLNEEEEEPEEQKAVPTDLLSFIIAPNYYRRKDLPPSGKKLVATNRKRLQTGHSPIAFV